LKLETGLKRMKLCLLKLKSKISRLMRKPDKKKLLKLKKSERLLLKKVPGLMKMRKSTNKKLKLSLSKLKNKLLKSLKLLLLFPTVSKSVK